MNKKDVYNYLLITFLFSYSLWGILIILTKFLNIKLDNLLCTSLYLLGSFGPVVGSYIVKKKNKSVDGFKDFLKKLFDFKVDILSYLFILFFLILYFIYPFILGKITLGVPLYVAILLIPLMIFGGGLEEAGWRWLLQPELEKKYSFVFATIITSIIWTSWHLPLFFIEGSSQANTNLISFFILIIGMSFAQSVLFHHSKKVSLAILLHCSFNAFQMAFVFEENILISICVTLIMIMGSLLVYIFKNKNSYSI